MPANKYEIQDVGVRSVMSRPPHLLILLGNTMIFVVVVLVLVLLNRITLPDYITIPIQVSGLEKNGREFDLITQKSVDSFNLNNKEVILQLGKENFSQKKYLISYMKKKDSSAIVIHVKLSEGDVDKQENNLINGSLGVAKIKIGERTILNRVKVP